MKEPEELTFQFLREITNGFSEELKVGEGAFGAVYRGMTKNGEDVAVKILRDDVKDLDYRQFRNEFYNVRKVKHINIVQVLGYCYEIEPIRIEYCGRIVSAEKTHKALCFEYLHNGSLQSHLYDESCGLDWHTRFKIIKGICEGLKYIHKDLGESLLHLDLKPDNILVDKNMVPKIADFGLSRIFGDKLTRTTRSPLGTIGYQPPEYIKRGEISEKFDIFSLGIIILKIVSGPKGYSKYLDMPSDEFIDQVQRNWRKRWQAACSSGFLEACHQVGTCIQIALNCLENDSQKRPDIVKIIDKLNEIETENNEPPQKRCKIFCGMKIHDEMKLTKGHRAISDQHQQLNFMLSSRSNMAESDNKQETSFNAGKELIVGREEKRKGIASSLQSLSEKIIIFPICGIGGIGKTTFARLIYNDSNFKYYSQVWVYVSPRFDLCEIGNSIISQLSGKENQANELQLIKSCITNLLTGKKILIVLDDLWENNTIQLVDLKDMLNPGDSIKTIVVVTTRSEDVAKKICSNIEPYKIEALTDEMCWDIIRQKSGFEARHDKEKLVGIGKDIARKCGGVALAAQTLGSMLQSKNYDEWITVKGSEIWNETISNDTSLTNRVLASLKLSYVFSMDDCLKSCFTYCAIFPKGHKIVKRDLIYQWISLGFIKPTLLSTSQLCEKYIVHLLGLTFLEHLMSPMTYGAYAEHDTVFTMHDLVHDLAISLLGDKILDQSKQGDTGGRNCCYALLSDCSKPLELCTTSPATLSAVHFLDCRWTELHGAAFERAESLRVLDLSGCSIQKLPVSIGRLKQLRYLNAPRIRDQIVPECITKLSNLRYLSLQGSCGILALPESIGKMEGLVHLDLSGWTRIEKLPESFGNLKRLEYVNFTDCINVTGVSECLAGLTKLQYLNLSTCRCIGELPTALGNLTELQYLDLSDSSYLYGNKLGEAEFLGSLTKLKYLNLSRRNKLRMAKKNYFRNDYSTGKLPESLGKLCNLVHLDLSFGSLCQDVSLTLNGLTKLQYLDLYSSFSGHYYFSPMEMDPEVFGNLSELRYLNLGFYIDKIAEDTRKSLLDRICTLTNLEYLNLCDNQRIYSIPDTLGNLRKLSTLDLSRCYSLWRLPASISELDSLKCIYTDGISHLDKSTLPQSKSSSKTALDFLVHLDDGESTFYELAFEGACLKIGGLEKVKSAKELPIKKFMKKQADISGGLALEWARDAKRYVDDEDVLKELEPPYSISIFQLRGYNSIRFPSWVMHIDAYLPHLTRIEMLHLPNCKNLPPLGQLPNLETLDIGGMDSIKEIGVNLYGGPRPFPQLERFGIHGMKWLEEWNGLDEIVFPCLSRVSIRDCPRLRFEPQPPRSIRNNLKLWICSSDDIMLSPRGNICHAAASTVTELELYKCWLPLHQWSLLRHLPCLQDLTILDCCDLTCKSLDFLRGLTSLTKLKILEHEWRRFRWVMSLPEGLGGLASLEVLEIHGCESIEILPHSIGQLTCLRRLILQGCKSIALLPEGLGGLASLTVLEICGCENIQILPHSIRLLTCLQRLILQGCKSIVSLPVGLGGLASLTVLEIRGCENIEILPRSIRQLTCLQRLILQGCKSIMSLPRGLGGLASLMVLEIRGCENIMILPHSIRKLICLQRLILQGCKSIVSLPEGLGDLASLEVLDISGCESIEVLPDSIQQLTCLHTLIMRSCKSMVSLPERMGDMTSLRKLDIRNCNGIRTLRADNMEQLTRLQELVIWGRQRPELAHNKRRLLDEDYEWGCPVSDPGMEQWGLTS